MQAFATDAIISLAEESRANAIAADARQFREYFDCRDVDLCKRLQHHLFEQQRALSRSEKETAARIHALDIARMLAEAALEARARKPDPDRQSLAQWLAVERTKFVMATRADALRALAAGIDGGSELPRHEIRRLATSMVRELALEELSRFWGRLEARLERSTAEAAGRLLADFEGSLKDLGESVPQDALAGLSRPAMRAFPRAAVAPSTAGVLMSFATRARIENVARDELILGLEDGSRRLAARLLDDYDDMRTALDQRFLELLAAAGQSVRVAAELVRDAHARIRLAQWSARLSLITARVPEGQ